MSVSKVYAALSAASYILNDAEMVRRYKWRPGFRRYYLHHSMRRLINALRRRGSTMSRDILPLLPEPQRSAVRAIYRLYLNPRKVRIADFQDHVTSILVDLRSKLIIGDPTQMTMDELFDLGFRKWDDRGLMLIPLYLLDALDPESKVVSVRGGTHLLRDVDEDYARQGLILYGYYASDSPRGATDEED